MSGPIKLDSRPLYVRAVDAIRSLIEEQPYLPGEQLPNEDRLAELLGISRTTLRMALGHLELQGAIERRQGIGTFVARQTSHGLRGGLESLQSIQSLAQKAGLNTETSEREVSLVPAVPEWAEVLGVEEGAPLHRVRFTISVDNLPIAYLNSLIPAAYASAAELASAPGSLLDFLISRGGPGPSYTHSQVYAIEADQEVAERLRVPQGKAVVHLVETYYAPGDEPVALSFNYFVSDRYSFFISRQIAP